MEAAQGRTGQRQHVELDFLLPTKQPAGQKSRKEMPKKRALEANEMMQRRGKTQYRKSWSNPMFAWVFPVFYGLNTCFLCGICVSVGGSYHCGALHGVWQIIWAQWRLIQLSAASTPALLQISGCTKHAASLQPRESVSVFQELGPLGGKKAGSFRLEAVGAARVPSGGFCFSQPRQRLLPLVHPPFTKERVAGWSFTTRLLMAFKSLY